MVSEMRYTDALGLSAGDVVSIVGSGGKTSLLWRLAEENRERGVLVSTTTKMRMPEVGAFDWDVSGDGTSGRPVAAPTGVSLFYGAVEDEKITTPEIGRLFEFSAVARLTLLECDGAKERPLKGWAEHEPVVPGFTSVTIGVLPLWVIGRIVCEEIVHRMPTFYRIAGALPGEIVTARHLARVINHPDGLFAKARGRQLLFLNYLENQKSEAFRRDFLTLLELLEIPKRTFLGDIHRGTIEVLR